MRVECPVCSKVYNFKKDKLPPYAFSFRCKKCAHKISVTEEEIKAAKTAAKKDKIVNKDATKKKVKLSVPKIQPEKLKKPLVKISGLLSGLTGRSERDWMFTLMKSVAYFSIGFLIVLIILGGFTYLSIGSNQAVTFAQVERSVELKLDPVVTIQAAVPNIKIPKMVEKYLGGDNKGTFVEWMNGLAENQKKDFIENLEQIIQQAQKKDPEHLYDYINEYKSLKFKKSVDKNVAKYLFKFGLIIAIITMLGLLGLYCLILLQINSQKTIVKG